MYSKGKLKILASFVVAIVVLIPRVGPSCAFAGTHASKPPQYTIYVSTKGNDSWSGSLPESNADNTDGPFRTLERARNEVRVLKRRKAFPQGGVTISIRGGVYPLTRTIGLNLLHSGRKASPIVYQAYGDEEVRLVGGKEITGFELCKEQAILRRLDEAVRDKIYQVDLKAQGIKDFGQLHPRGYGRPLYPAGLELFFQDKPMQLARWPNEGWIRIAGVPEGQQGGKFIYAGDRPDRWLGAEDVWLHDYWRRDWADLYVKLATINTQAKEITTQAPYGVPVYGVGKRYYALNILEELDAPGEWYLDRKTGILYFWPPESLNEGKVFASILEKPMVSLDDVSYVTLRDLTFEATRGTAVEVIGRSHNLIAGCTFRNIGNLAVNIKGGTKTGVVGCDIFETGDGGIVLSGGDRQKLRPAGNFAVNNHIHHFSRWSRTYRPAVKISGVGNRIANNLIHDGPHMGVWIKGNEHVLEFNEVHSVCQETGDVGAFYLGGDWTERGNIIRYNFFHDIHAPYSHGANILYLDDFASGTSVFGNIFQNVHRGVAIGGGRDNIIENNIFLDCKRAVWIDARGMGWASRSVEERGGARIKLNRVPYRFPPWSIRYPRLVHILQEQPHAPKGNIVRLNLHMGGVWCQLPQRVRACTTVERNLTDADPGFVNPAKGNWELRKDSPAFKLGFQRIPRETIGLYNDELRASWPAELYESE